MILVPVDPTLSSDQTFRVRLVDRVATVRLQFNERSQRWLITIANEAGAFLGCNKLVPNWPIFTNHKGLNPLPGDWFVFPMDKTASEPIGYFELGSRWGLFWADDTEVTEWKVANGLE